MYKELKFVRTDTKKLPFKYLFELVLNDDNSVFFYTFRDLSGFGFEFCQSAQELISVGIACIAEKNKIEEAIKCASKKLKNK